MRLLAPSIACDIHALNILCELNYLVKTLGVSEDQKNNWNCHWVARGFAALEARLAAENEADLFFHGKQPTLVDICLIPEWHLLKPVTEHYAVIPAKAGIQVLKKHRPIGRLWMPAFAGMTCNQRFLP